MQSLQSLTDGSSTHLAQLQQAIDAHMAGHLEQAAAVYEAVLEEDPIHPVALHYYGIWLHQVGRHDEAVEKLMLSCALESDDAGWHNDLGNVLFALGRMEESAQAYADALAVTPQDHTIWNNLGATQLQLQQTAEATESFKRAVEIAPDFVPALLHLGSIFEAAGDKMQASHYQCRAYVLPPLEGKSKEMLGISFYFLGRLPEAAQAYRAWLADEPDNPVAAHMLAACSQADVPARASDRYIEFHFDRYADTFESNLLESLGYRGPRLIGEGLGMVAQPARQFEAIDIGCGTGLCGPYMAPFSHRITGVDLAGKMLAKAAAAGHYAQLEKAEIGDYLARNPGSCDLVAAADTMIYFGELESVFRHVAGALRKDGYFIFTVEAVTPQDAAPSGFCLHASGRYRHSRDYVHLHLNNNGMEVVHDSEQVLREEIRQSVAGMLFVARRTEQAAA
ncbi:tetratricopeptide repeat protein [Herbaspirillum sp. LeCh32-8]|uniref:tetratricopeptide repeat protein n=1 Tax=Herbaspirillum sp. LeCh32-8 TaxID=2821356 RepID=UPI001AE55BD0|nr:tetratricopeptide repeat protein [Herbaspirillum sp. LeCh32-8]MBP0599736.1 tetratricopeptide repeat protein [Herbaspirillum sp. LeCh32-8]